MRDDFNEAEPGAEAMHHPWFARAQLFIVCLGWVWWREAFAGPARGLARREPRATKARPARPRHTAPQPPFRARADNHGLRPCPRLRYIRGVAAAPAPRILITDDQPDIGEALRLLFKS